MDDIMQELPPLALVKTWIDVAQQVELPNNIREKRLKLLKYYLVLWHKQKNMLKIMAIQLS